MPKKNHAFLAESMLINCAASIVCADHNNQMNLYFSKMDRFNFLSLNANTLLIAILGQLSLLFL